MILIDSVNFLAYIFAKTFDKKYGIAEKSHIKLCAKIFKENPLFGQHKQRCKKILENLYEIGLPNNEFLSIDEQVKDELILKIEASNINPVNKSQYLLLLNEKYPTFGIIKEFDIVFFDMQSNNTENYDFAINTPDNSSDIKNSVFLSLKILYNYIKEKLNINPKIKIRLNTDNTDITGGSEAITILTSVICSIMHINRNVLATGRIDGNTFCWVNGFEPNCYGKIEAAYFNGASKLIIPDDAAMQCMINEKIQEEKNIIMDDLKKPAFKRWKTSKLK